MYLDCDILAEEGENAESLVFLIHGSAKVTKIGRIMPVSLLKPGDYFGKAFANVCGVVCDDVILHWAHQLRIFFAFFFATTVMLLCCCVALCCVTLLYVCMCAHCVPQVKKVC